MTEKQKYIPNQVSLSTRLLRTGGAIILIAHGVIGIVRDDVIIPAKRSVLHMHGVSGWIVALSMFSAALVLLGVVFDHFDRRDNEAAYKQFGRNMARLAWGLMGLGMGLHAAGVNYPGPSNLSTFGIVGGLFIFCCAIAMGFANEKAVERERTAPVPSQVPAPGLTPSALPVPKTSPAPVSGVVVEQPFRVDRAFGGLLLMIVGALTFLGALPGLAKFLVIQYGIAALAVMLMVIGWLIFSGRKTSKPADGGQGKPRNWRPIRIGIILVVGLAAIWYVKVRQWNTWQDKDNVEQRSAPAWQYALGEFSGDVTRDDVQRTLSAAGFRVRCYGGLQPQEKMNPDDTEACWTIANNVFGIPSRMISFTFGDDGLHNIRLDFPRDQWPAVSTWYASQGAVVPGDFGRDQMGSKVLSRRGESGLVMTSEPGVMGQVMVVFLTRERFIDQSCGARFENDPQWQMICRDWSPIARPSGFVLRSRPQLMQQPSGIPPEQNVKTQGQR